LPPGFDATSVATSRCTSGIEYAPAVTAKTHEPDSKSEPGS
jgi:hypothetical protein